MLVSVIPLFEVPVIRYYKKIHIFPLQWHCITPYITTEHQLMYHVQVFFWPDFTTLRYEYFVLFDRV